MNNKYRASGFSCEPSTKTTKEKSCKMRKCFCRLQSCKVWRHCSCEPSCHLMQRIRTYFCKLTGEKLMSLLQASGAPADDASVTSLSRSVTSVGERTTGSTASPPPLPKRADTFSGFETRDANAHRSEWRHSMNAIFLTSAVSTCKEFRFVYVGAKKRYGTSVTSSTSRDATSHSSQPSAATPFAKLDESDSGLGLDSKVGLQQFLNSCLWWSVQSLLL